ncbi:MAG TPA: hypothetical protein VE992_05955 [Solirubrobacteraceae bacterium]|nr:hypothetical protein [Solirubrobacteraceae bacterium]
MRVAGPPGAAALRGVCPVVYGGRDRLFAGQGRRLEALHGEIGVDHFTRSPPGHFR